MRIGNAQKYTDKILNFIKEMSESDSESMSNPVIPKLGDCCLLLKVQAL